VPLEVFLRQEEWREDLIVIELCPSSWRNDVLWDFSQGYVLTEEYIELLLESCRLKEKAGPRFWFAKGIANGKYI
jgi:hypothetical protein